MKKEIAEKSGMKRTTAEEPGKPANPHAIHIACLATKAEPKVLRGGGVAGGHGNFEAQQVPAYHLLARHLRKGAQQSIAVPKIPTAEKKSPAGGFFAFFI